MPQISQDLLKLDTYDVYFLINLCSENSAWGDLCRKCWRSQQQKRFSTQNRNANSGATQKRPLNVPLDSSWQRFTIIQSTQAHCSAFCRAQTSPAVTVCHTGASEESVSGKDLDHGHLLSYSWDCCFPALAFSFPISSRVAGWRFFPVPVKALACCTERLPSDFLLFDNASNKERRRCREREQS